MRRSKLTLSDLPKNVAQTWIRAERAARRKNFNRARIELRKTLRRLPSLQRLPMEMIKRKYERVRKRYSKQKKKGRLSKRRDKKVLKALLNSQQATFDGFSRKANKYLNKALRQL